MKVLLAIPSKARAQQIQGDIMPWLEHSKYKADARIFVEPQEREAYENDKVPTVSISGTDLGLGFAKKKIQEYAQVQGYDLIFKLDDDITGWAMRDHKTTPINSAKWFDQAIDASIAKFEKYPDLAAVGFPYRFELWEPKEWQTVNARLQTAYLVRTDRMYADDRFSSFEDFHTYLMIRMHNMVTLRYGLIGIACKPVGKNAGGHQALNRVERATKELELLKQIYPALKLRRVEGKDWELEPSMRGELFGVKAL